MAENLQQKLGRIGKPRVHVTYDAKCGGHLEKRELPFVVGVLGHFSGNPTAPLKPLNDRKFIELDRDNFNLLMEKIKPGVNLKVANTIKGDGSELAVQLKFNALCGTGRPSTWWYPSNSPPSCITRTSRSWKVPGGDYIIS